MLLSFAATVIIHIILLVVAKILEKIFNLDAVEKASVIYSNSGNLIIPIVTSVLGKEWIIYTSAFISVQLVLIWTHGKMVICEENKIDLKKILLNINMISVILGIILFAAHIELPYMIRETMESVSVMIGPICMIVGGMLIGNIISDGSTILLISLLAAIAPSASTVTQMAQIYDKNSEYASAINVVTTIVCIITMPVIVWMYQM